MNEWKATKVHMHAQSFSTFIPAWEDLLKFETTAWNSYHWSICCPTAKVQSLPRLLHGAIHFLPMNWTYNDTGFYSGQTSFLNMKVLTFAKDENTHFF